MYYRRWTRMQLLPGMKYLIKYGVISPKYDKYFNLLQTQNPKALQYNRKSSLLHRKPTLVQKDFDTKLINQLFLKYPDLQYEPITQQKIANQPLNTFSYAYSFITEQKRLIKQGYTVSKAFELTEEKYHLKMQRKLDQSLLARGLAFGNRARSFLNVYQQQAEYESRLKEKRTKREMEKYDLKLKSIRELVQGGNVEAEVILDEETLDHSRIFYSVKEHNRSVDSNQAMEPVGYTEIPTNDSRQRYQYIDQIEGKFKNLFSNFYQHSASKDKLEGLTDQQIINQLRSSPSKMKRQMKELNKYLDSRNIKLGLQKGKIIVTGSDSQKLPEQLKTNKYLKIALLSQALNYEKSTFGSDNSSNSAHIGQTLRHKSLLSSNRPDPINAEQKSQIQANKRKDLDLVSQTELAFNKQAYKMFETEEERLLRLEVKYYDLLIDEINRKRNQSQDKEEAEVEREEQLVARRKETVQNFRRLKYRLEGRYRNTSAEELLFPQHLQLEKGVDFEDGTEYEELLGYLRKKNDDRRLTSLDQSKDNKINKYIRVLQISEGAIAEGSTPHTD